MYYRIYNFSGFSKEDLETINKHDPFYYYCTYDVYSYDLFRIRTVYLIIFKANNWTHAMQIRRKLNGRYFNPAEVYNIDCYIDDIEKYKFGEPVIFRSDK